LEYTATHNDLSKNFEVTENILNDYKEFLNTKEFEYKIEEEEQLTKLKKLIGKDEEYARDAEPIFAELQQIIEKKKEDDFEDGLDFIKMYIKAEISAKLWGTAAKVEASFDTTPEVQKAIEVLSDDEQYYAILSDKKN
jgi:hydroxylamine reductase (hybrid-cluster protein)